MEDGGRNRSVVLAGGGIGKICKPVMPVMGIDPRGQAGRLSQQTRHRKMAVGIFHRLRELDVRIAGRFRHIENHVVALGFKSFQPCRIGLRFRKTSRRCNAPDKRDGQMRRPRGRQQGFAISQYDTQQMRLGFDLTRLMKTGQNKNRLFALSSVTEEMNDGHADAIPQQKVW